MARLAYRVAEPTAEHVLGLELRRRDGLLVYGASRKLGVALGPGAGRQGSVEVEFPELPLLAGSYDVTASIARADGGATGWPARSQPRGFSVWSETGQAGLVAMRPRWVAMRKELAANQARNDS